MSKVSIGILFTAIALVIVATYFEVAFVAGGSGVVIVVALCYSYVVARREMALMSVALEQAEEERAEKAKSTPVPTEVRERRAQFV